MKNILVTDGLDYIDSHTVVMLLEVIKAFEKVSKKTALCHRRMKSRKS
ncbi:MAG: hypothetical protein WAT53_10745 [Nitrosomonas sp.]|jgi:UDP-glucose 4-epimerase|nr:hypothetical protein [Nitrosomonas sp.]MCC7136711.1 hypothetical protein [Nitrosomonas sp.]